MTAFIPVSAAAATAAPATDAANHHAVEDLSALLVPKGSAVLPSTGAPYQASSAGATIQSAVGAAFFGAACFNGVCWPGGQLGHIIRGSGYRVTYQEGYFTDLVGAETSGIRLCNWRIDFREYDRNNKVVSEKPGTVNKGCTILANGRKNTVARTLPSSTQQSCAELYTGGNRIARQCHWIS